MKTKIVRIDTRNIITVASEKHPVVTTDAEIDTAIAASNAAPTIAAVSANYDPATDKVRVWFDNGSDLGFPRARLQGLEHALVKQLQKIEIEGPGTGLYWPALGIAHYIPGLLEGVFGSRSWMATLGKKGGSAKTVAKAVSARTNGKKGGRPPIGVPATRVAYAKKSASGGGRKKRKG